MLLGSGWGVGGCGWGLARLLEMLRSREVLRA